MCPEPIRKSLMGAFPFLQELTGDDLSKLLGHCRYNEIPVGTYIMNENIECSGITLVVNGLIRIFKLSDEGKEVTLYRIGRGETCVLTASCLLGSGVVPFPVSAITEHVTTMVVVPLDVFKRFFDSNEHVRSFLFSAMSAKFYAVLGLVENITFKRTNERLMDLLISKTAGGAYPLYATHEAIASELGTAREVISRLLKEFERDGVVTLQRGKVILKSLKRQNIETV